MEQTLVLQKPKRIGKKVSLETPFALGSSAFIWQALFFYIPLVLMILSSLFKVSEFGSITGLTLNHFKAICSAPYFKIIGNSLGLGLITAVICLCIGYPVAQFMTTHGKKHKTLLLILLMVPFWTNFLLHVCAWYFVLEREGFINLFLLKMGFIHEPLHLLNSPFSVILMMVYYFLPFMILPLYGALDKFDQRLVSASEDLGANTWQTFTRISLPILLPAIRSGFFLVLIPSFGEFVIPELMGGDKMYFVGSVVSQFVLGENTSSLGAAFTVISACALILFSIVCSLGLTKGVGILSRRRT
jgi:spermidine/putrescine transport system permease protein